MMIFIRSIQKLTKLEKHDDWYIWTPKRGRYKGRTIYVAAVIHHTENETLFAEGNLFFKNPTNLNIAAILAFESKTTHEMTIHKGEITAYQAEKNTVKLKDETLIQQLNEMFLEYKPKWEEKRLIKDAKRLLMGSK